MKKGSTHQNQTPLAATSVAFGKNRKVTLFLILLCASVARAVDPGPGEVSFANFPHWVPADQVQHLKFARLSEVFLPSTARTKGYSEFCHVSPFLPTESPAWYRRPVRRVDVRFLMCPFHESVEY